MPTKRLLYALCLCLVLSTLAWLPEVAAAQPPDLPYDEAEAQAIDRMLICPVCPAETIDQAQVELARQMRQRVREMLAQGATRDEVLAFFVERYGTEVLAAPPKSGVNLVAWIFPAVGVVAALGAGLLVLRSMTGSHAGRSAAQPPPEEELEPYLQVVDQQLSLEEELGKASEGGGQKTRNASVPEPRSVDSGREGGQVRDG